MPAISFVTKATEVGLMPMSDEELREKYIAELMEEKGYSREEAEEIVDSFF